MTEITGLLSATDLRFTIIVSRFNDFISKRLLEGAIDALERHGAAKNSLQVIWVPGAVEIPLVAKTVASSNQADAIITLGCVIRGSTSHYDHVCAMISSGINQVSLEAGLPVIFGVLTTDTIEQAIERSGSKAGNKGFDAAVGAIEMAQVISKLKASKRNPKLA